MKHGTGSDNQVTHVWAQQPNVLFIQTEAQFQKSTITDDTTKYYHVVAALNQGISSRILDKLYAPEAENKYPSLKHRLLNVLNEILTLRGQWVLVSR